MYIITKHYYAHKLSMFLYLAYVYWLLHTWSGYFTLDRFLTQSLILTNVCQFSNKYFQLYPLNNFYLKQICTYNL